MRNCKLGIGLIFIVSFLLASCNANTLSIGGESAEETVNGETSGKNDTITKSKDFSKEFTPEENFVESPVVTGDESGIIAEKINGIDFTVKNSPIDAERYTPEIDKKYKEAYLKAINNLITIKRQDTGEAIFFQDLLRGERLTGDDFQEYILKPAKFFYLDFDGCGLPELCIEADGPTVLKYDLEEDEVYMHYRSSDKWHILGSGQVYYFDPTSANRIVYCYEAIDEHGKTSQRVFFNTYYAYNEEAASWDTARLISIDGHDNVIVTEDEWDKMSMRFFKAIDEPVSPQAYDEIFADYVSCLTNNYD